MASKFGLDISGEKELDAALSELSSSMQTRYMNKALEAGAQRIRAKWRALVPVDTGALRDGIEIIKAKRSRRHIAYMIAFPTREHLAKHHAAAATNSLNSNRRLSSKASDIESGKWYYPAVVEWGGIKKDGTRIPAQAPGRRAFAASEHRAFRVTVDVLWKQIEAFRKRQAKKALKAARTA